MGFVRNDFGTLSSVKKDDSFVWITNTNGESRKMSLGKYQESAEVVYAKAKTLVGQEVNILTSQNTAEWSTSEWFSDIFEK
jgi:hypothetical protein